MKRVLHVYEIEDGETHWYVANSPATALREYVKQEHGGTVAKYRKDTPKDEQASVVQCADDRNLPVIFEGEMGGTYDGEIIKTCREWADESGPGILATTLI